MNETWIKEYLQRFPCVLRTNGNIRTCPVRLSFPQLWEAKSIVIKGVAGKPKFGSTLLFPKTADLSVLVKACAAAATEKFSDKWKAKLPNGSTVGKGAKLIEFPFHDGEECDGMAGFESGAYFLRVYSDSKPGVVDSRAMAITDKSSIYPGVWALVTIRAFAYDVDVNKGVSFGLQNVQKIADDESLGAARSTAEEEFEPLDDEGTGSHGNGKADSLDGLGNLAGL
jgi:Protein of unknown function (DUF2815)